MTKASLPRWTAIGMVLQWFLQLVSRFHNPRGVVSDRTTAIIAACLGVIVTYSADCTAQDAVQLPNGVLAVWDMAKAQRETTPTRERICLNGLWQWQPASSQPAEPPAKNWGYFKVPGCWPGISDYMQKDSQTVFSHPSWKDQKPGNITAAWHQREITVPGTWTGRRLAISIEYLNSYAAVYVDGKQVGEIRFPGGEVDVSTACRPGSTHKVSVFVAALPLKGVMLSYTDSASAREVKGSVPRRGICGDVYLVSTPAAARLTDIKIATSVRKQEVTFEAALADVPAVGRFALRARISKDGRQIKEFTSRPFQAGDLQTGRVAFTEKWLPEQLWDIHTPQNTWDLELSLLDATGGVIDAGWQTRFGFREFWIEGRDFYLNGSRIYLSSVPLDNGAISAGLATYAAARESLERLKTFGINMVYTHNYGCEPGSHLGFTEILRAADDVGMLISFSQPHFSHYEWPTADADQTNGYARHAEFYVRAAQNHPAVVFYSMSHNGTGYNEDMNPDMIDGVAAPRDNWSTRNVKSALRAEAIVQHLDPNRIIYHHASGNLSSMDVINFYPNFVPIQELSDWFEYWATEGIKPVFTCEYGAPFTWDWTMYRGWYKGQREFGSAAVPWEFCIAEWNSQFFGDRAFQISEPEKANLRWEAKQLAAGKGWHRWDYPYAVGSTEFDERYPVFARYITDNWRAFRTWGISGNSPWEHGHFWKLRDGVDKRRQELKVDWDNLQRPGFSPDYIDQRYERIDLAFDFKDWIATPASEALIRNNAPVLAYLGGKPARFTSKDHIFFPGDTVEKQIIVINNSRETLTCDCQWTLGLPQTLTGAKKVSVATGQQERIPLSFKLPDALPPGRYELSATFKFGNGVTQQDSFSIQVLPRPVSPTTTGSKIALFDPVGETGALLKRAGVDYQVVKPDGELPICDVLIIGKSALTLSGPAPGIERVRDGLKVIVFEQTSEVLEQRFGFRVAEYGLRQVFPRVPDHPLLAGLTEETLRDWTGAATILPAKLKYEMSPRGVAVQWCGISETRLWRCGNRGNVASVLIEKPTRGDFLPLLDGGYSLQYSPLMEYREGRGMVLFCQMDVTGRTENDPAAETLMRNILQYMCAAKPVPRRTALYAGEPAGQKHLDSVGAQVTAYDGKELLPDQVLIVGPGGGQMLVERSSSIANWLKSGGHLLAIGLNQTDANPMLPVKVSTKQAEHIAAFFEPAATGSLLAGVGPSDVHNRDPRQMPLISGGAQVTGDGVLARLEGADAVFCQIVPWAFGGSPQANLRRTHRRASFLVSRLLSNMGVASSTPLIQRFHNPVVAGKTEKRWQDGFYLDQPEEWDDPYRFFRW